MEAHGFGADSPAALIFNGTLPSQETIQGTLTEVIEAVRRRTLRDPAILVVGRVAALREHCGGSTRARSSAGASSSPARVNRRST